MKVIRYKLVGDIQVYYKCFKSNCFKHYVYQFLESYFTVTDEKYISKGSSTFYGKFS